MAPQGRRIVVGVDGSRAAHAAVRWAAQQARELGRELVLLHAREDGRPTPFPAIPPDGDADDDELLPYRDELGDLTSLTVRRQLADGPPARTLVAASADAVMVVVGRPRKRLSSWPGPTSLTRRLLAGAHCPVVLVPERTEGRS